MDADKLWKLLDSVQSQVRVFDAKAQIVIAIDGILAAFFGTQTAKMAELVASQPGSVWSILLVSVGVVCVGLLLCSLMLAVATVHPRLHLNQPNSRLFFAHICHEFGRDYARVREALGSLSTEELGADLANQILANSLVCGTKAQRIKHALYAMSAAVIIWIIILFIQFAAQERVAFAAPHVQSLSTATTNKADGPPTVENIYLCKPDTPGKGVRGPARKPDPSRTP